MSPLTDKQKRDLENLRDAWQAEDQPFTASESGAHLSGAVHDILHAFGVEWDHQAEDYRFPWERAPRSSRSASMVETFGILYGVRPNLVATAGDANAVLEKFNSVYDRTMRRFELHRIEDKSGVSGTGVVAEGLEFSDGHACLRWKTQFRSTAIYDSMKDVEAVHGHGGATKIVWVDE